MIIQTDYYRLQPFGNLLYIETFSAWDGRVSRAYIDDIRTIALKQYAGTPWAMLVDRQNWELHTPGAEQLLAEGIGGTFKTPLSHVAVVTGSSEIKKWQVAKISKHAATIRVQLFETLTDAREWLGSQGFDMTPIPPHHQDQRI